MQRLTLFTSIGADRTTRHDEVSSERVSERASDTAMERMAARVRRNATTRSSRRADDTQDSDTERTSRPAVSKAEFSALLAMIAGAGAQMRADLVSQLPPETASLVDRLLDGASPDAIGDVLSEQSADASEALRNGLRTLGAARGESVADATGDTSTDANGPTPIAPAMTSDVAARAAAKQRNLETIARILSTRGNSMEQLLAVGDTEAAKTRAALDALLSKAGTPEGARLAARSALSQTNAALLAGDADASTETNALRNARDVTAAMKDVNALDPELQARLAKVQERMAALGHDVQIVETTRSQDRQDWLFAQGRTRGGPVVTWTRDSAHTRGDAVDVMIDGSYTNTDAFALLQRVAREEGLRTLGDRDPGHLELKGEGAASGQLANAQADGTTSARAMTSHAGMASVARVAGVAGVANVAAPGRGVRAVRSESLESPDGNGVTAMHTRGNASLGAIAMDARRDAQNGTQHGMSQDGAMPGDARRDRSRDGIGGDSDAPAFGALHSNATLSHSTTSATTVTPHAGVAQADRVADIQQMRADAPVAPISRMTLDVDGANGAERITIDVRGNSVQAHIATDADTAGRLRLHTAELQDALGRHGLDGDTVRISAASRAEQTDAVRGNGDREVAARLVTTSANAQDGTNNENAQNQQGRAPTREWDRQDTRRDQARARDEQQERQQDARQQPSHRDEDRRGDDAQERQRRTTPFFGQV